MEILSTSPTGNVVDNVRALIGWLLPFFRWGFDADTVCGRKRTIGQSLVSRRTTTVENVFAAFPCSYRSCESFVSRFRAARMNADIQFPFIL